MFFLLLIFFFVFFFFFFSSRRRHTRCSRDWSSDVCSSDLEADRMAEIVRKIGKITKYETKSYVGKQKILDLDRASEEAEAADEPPAAESLRGETVPESSPTEEEDSGPRSEPRRVSGALPGIRTKGKRE